MIAFRCSVDMFSIRSSITKIVWRVKVVKMDAKNVTIDDYGTKVKVPRADIFDTAEEAEAECEKRAQALKAKLQVQLAERLAELDLPPSKSDRVPKPIDDVTNLV